jgi:hypothetical protein
MKVYNYTIVESLTAYNRFARENFGMRISKKGEELGEDDIKETVYG